jgi:putative transposase
MTATTTKTLEATLAPPTAHKERKLCDLLDTYRAGLHEAFEADCETMTATSDVVTPYDLPYQAKAALCNYVPQLHGTYDAQELDDDHPVRLTNQAAEFDHSPERDYEFTWWVPQPGRGTNFWLPLRISPAQEDLWHDLVDGESSAGQLRLQRHRTSWTLHVTVEFPVEETAYEPSDDDVTPVGFDIGEAHLLAGCAYEQDTPTDPLLINGGRARHLRKEMHTTHKRLQERDAAQWRIDERFDHYQNALTDSIEKASRQAIEYVCRFENACSRSGSPLVHPRRPRLRRVDEPTTPRMGVRSLAGTHRGQSTRGWHPGRIHPPRVHEPDVSRVRPRRVSGRR